MKMSTDNNLKAVCSVIEMAKQLDLSRTRFYQLQKQGVFPPPIYCVNTKRPYYPLDLQKKCIHIRKTGVGFNGRLILFNTVRKTKSNQSQNESVSKYEDLRHILAGFGLNVTAEKVKNATGVLYPKEQPKCLTEEQVIRDVFNFFTDNCNTNV